jgi:hypothetical protein
MTTVTGTRGVFDIQLGDRALIVCDIDEVVLEFVTPFNAYLMANGHELLPRSFRLTGNVVSVENGTEASSQKVGELLDSFFAHQADWQKPAKQVATALSNLSDIADILFLTAMPPQHYDVRRGLLDSHGMPFPLIATEDAKGPLIRDLHDDRPLPLIFIDDMVYNLHSVKQHAPQAKMLHYMANETFRAMAPHPGDDVTQADDWHEIEMIIKEHVKA